MQIVELAARARPRPSARHVIFEVAKGLVGIRFVERDEPGYWETRGYHNRADPWLEQRYAQPWPPHHHASRRAGVPGYARCIATSATCSSA
ncbi:MAG: hypothetical protein R6X02_02950 [Enhygromyxa sp.]